MESIKSIRIIGQGKEPTPEKILPALEKIIPSSSVLAIQTLERSPRHTYRVGFDSAEPGLPSVF